MNFSCNDKISNNQLRAIIGAAFMGTFAVSMPVGVIELSGGAAYISTFLGGLSAAVLMWALIIITGRSFNESFEDTAVNCLGRVLGRIVLLMIFIHTAYFCGLQLSYIGRMMQDFTERNISQYCVLFVITVVSSYAASRGSECIGRLSEIAFIAMLIFIVFIFVISAPSMDLDILKPVSAEIKNIPASSFRVFAYLSTAGYVFLLLPKSKSQKGSALSVFSSFIIITVVIAFGTALAVSCFGIDESIRKTYPVIQMMNYIEFPGSLVERQEVLMSGFYIFSAFILSSVGIYICSGIMEKFFNSKKRSLFIVVSWTALLLASLAALKWNGFLASKLFTFNLIMYAVALCVPFAALLSGKVSK